MRYASRTAKAIEAVGGREALMALMAEREFCTNPLRTLETWLERKRISGEGRDFIWRLASAKEIAIGPDDFEVVDESAGQDEAA